MKNTPALHTTLFVFGIIAATHHVGCHESYGKRLSVQGDLGKTPPLRTVRKKQIRKALKKSLVYLDNLHVDPVELQRKGIKGKKKLAEILDAYKILWTSSPSTELGHSAKKRFRSLTTLPPQFHDMSSVDDKTFRENSTSYLRIAYLMARMGMDTKHYLSHIKKVLPRLNAHLKKRGHHQRMAFQIYYDQLGIERPTQLNASFTPTRISRLQNPYNMKKAQVYALAHEIFCLFKFGDSQKKVKLSPSQNNYLHRSLEILTVLAIRHRKTDLLGELLTCMALIGCGETPVYSEGLHYLITHQNPNGSWGSYPYLRKRYGDSTDIRFVLHTTLVCIEALALSLKKQTPSAT